MILVIAFGYVFLMYIVVILLIRSFRVGYPKELKKLIDCNKKVLKELEKIEKNNKPQDTLGH